MDKLLTVHPDKELIFKGPFIHGVAEEIIWLKNKSRQNVIYQISIEGETHKYEIHPRCGIIPPNSTIQIRVSIKPYAQPYVVVCSENSDCIVINAVRSHGKDVTDQNIYKHFLGKGEAFNPSLTDEQASVYTKKLKSVLLDNNKPDFDSLGIKGGNTDPPCKASSSSSSIYSIKHNQQNFEDNNNAKTFIHHDANTGLETSNASADIYWLTQEYRLLVQENANMKLLKRELQKTCMDEVELKSLRKHIKIIHIFNIFNITCFLILIGYWGGSHLGEKLFQNDDGIHLNDGTCNDPYSRGCGADKTWFWFE